MKRKVLLIIIAILIAAITALVACKLLTEQQLDDQNVQENVQETAAPTFTPEPTPEPLPPLFAVVDSGADETFIGSIDSIDGIRIVRTSLEDASGQDDLTGIFVYLNSREDAGKISDLLKGGVPVIVYNRCNAELPEEVITVSNASRSNDDLTQLMEETLAYPPHDTPVRLFGVFSSEESDAAKIWANYVSEGKILSKGVYYGEKDESYAEWVEKKLDQYFPGMVDAAFCENPDFACAMVNAQAARNRDDFEVFSAGNSDELMKLAALQPRILPNVASYNDSAAADTVVFLINAVASGETPEDVTLEAE